PLRRRREELPALVRHFIAETARANRRALPALDDEALALLLRHRWPGNVRELRNAIERAVLLARGEVILTEHLPKRMQQEPAASVQTEESVEPGTRMEDVERAAILKALRECQFNRTEAARTLGISRRTLTYRLQTYRRQGYPVDSE
ncbi:MAG: two-component system, NtrC family, response regulator AtoC, partial [Candidatus Hydrogenedentes bacterium]|nr:two-component system, NtrC family, response regulator AtoC [Candidatus Hydrogenedentota bacterium]